MGRQQSWFTVQTGVVLATRHPGRNGWLEPAGRFLTIRHGPSPSAESGLADSLSSMRPQCNAATFSHDHLPIFWALAYASSPMSTLMLTIFGWVGLSKFRDRRFPRMKPAALLTHLTFSLLLSAWTPTLDCRCWICCTDKTRIFTENRLLACIRLSWVFSAPVP